MTDDIKNTYDEDENTAPPPIIPPWILLAGAGAAFVTALGMLLATPGFGVVGWGALAVGVLLLVLLVVLAPQQTVNFLTGRSVRFGGTSILVTIFFLGLLGTIYWFVAEQGWSVDVTQTDQFSLNDDARDTITQFAADPTIPPVELIGFYDSTQSGLRDQIEPLLRDYQNASNGKVTYRFVNPDRDVALASQYNATSGSLVVVNSTETDPQAASVLSAGQTTDQNQISNAIIEAVASGEFNVYFLEVDGGVSLTGQGEAGAALFVEQLGRYNWNFQSVTISELTSVESDITLNDPNADGEVLVIPGGSSLLSDSEVAFITSYIDAGGNVVIAALPDGQDRSLVSTEALNTYLDERFGLSFGDEIILDPRNARGGLANLIDVSNITRPISLTQYVPNGASVLFNSARPIIQSDDTADGVQVYTLAQTGTSAYSKSLDELIDQDSEQNDDDPAGPFVVLAAAEDDDSGARVVLAGSNTLFLNAFIFGQQLGNFEAGFGALAWAMDYENFEQGQQLFLPDFDTRPEDVPVNANPQQLSTINFISLFLLPFGTLAIGGVVWYFRRQS